MTDDKNIWIEYARKVGELTQGLKDLKSNFDNHIKEHRIDRIMQYIIIGLQTVVIVFLGYLKVTGKI